MKKRILILPIICFSLFLSGCKDDKKSDKGYDNISQIDVSSDSDTSSSTPGLLPPSHF